MEKETQYKEALMKLNMQYKDILNSKEFLLGREILKTKYFLGKGKIFYVLSKIFTNKKRWYLYKKENGNNSKLFKDNENYIVKQYYEN